MYTLSMFPAVFSFPPVHIEPKKNLEQRDLWRLSGPYIFSLPYTSHSTHWKRSKEVNEFVCSVNFGLDAFGRGELSTVLSFVIPTYVNVGK